MYFVYLKLMQLLFGFIVTMQLDTTNKKPEEKLEIK